MNFQLIPAPLIVVLFSIELAATLLLGAQVISEYEQLESRLAR